MVNFHLLLTSSAHLNFPEPHNACLVSPDKKEILHIISESIFCAFTFFISFKLTWHIVSNAIAIQKCYVRNAFTNAIRCSVESIILQLKLIAKVTLSFVL